MKKFVIRFVDQKIQFINATIFLTISDNSERAIASTCLVKRAKASLAILSRHSLVFHASFVHFKLLKYRSEIIPLMVRFHGTATG